MHVAKNGLANLKGGSPGKLSWLYRTYKGVLNSSQDKVWILRINKGALEELCAIIRFCAHIERTGFNEWTHMVRGSVTKRFPHCERELHFTYQQQVIWELQLWARGNRNLQSITITKVLYPNNNTCMPHAVSHQNNNLLLCLWPSSLCWWFNGVGSQECDSSNWVWPDWSKLSREREVDWSSQLSDLIEDCNQQHKTLCWQTLHYPHKTVHYRSEKTYTTWFSIWIYVLLFPLWEMNSFVCYIDCCNSVCLGYQTFYTLYTL